MKLYLITNGNNDPLYVCANSLRDLVGNFPTATKIEHVSDQVSVNSLEIYDILVKAYKFIKSGANTYTNEERVALEKEIEDCFV